MNKVIVLFGKHWNYEVAEIHYNIATEYVGVYSYYADSDRLKKYNQTDTCKKSKRKYYESHKKQIKQYRIKNKERIAKQRKQYYNKNKERILKQNKEYRVKNKEKIRTMVKKYQSSKSGKIAKGRVYAKRKRNLGFNILYKNPFSDLVLIEYHHINNNDVVALPRGLHKIYSGYGTKAHRELCMSIVKQIYKGE